MSPSGTTRKKTAVVMTSALLRSPDVARDPAYFAIVPKGDIGLLLNHLVRAGKDGWRDGEAQRLGGLQIDDQLVFRGLLNR